MVGRQKKSAAVARYLIPPDGVVNIVTCAGNYIAHDFELLCIVWMDIISSTVGCQTNGLRFAAEVEVHFGLDMLKVACNWFTATLHYFDEHLLACD